MTTPTETRGRHALRALIWAALFTAGVAVAVALTDILPRPVLWVVFALTVGWLAWDATRKKTS